MFWRRPLATRMADFATLREAEPFTASSSRHPDRRQGLVPLGDPIRRRHRGEQEPEGVLLGERVDLDPGHAHRPLEFFGSFITMDDPRHAASAASSGARSRTAPAVGARLGRRICTEVIDDMCEQGEVDLVQAISAPFHCWSSAT